MDLLACVNYYRANAIENPVNILRYAQSVIVRGRPLDAVQDVSESLKGETNFILINQQDVSKSAMDEMQFLKDPTLTLSVGCRGLWWPSKRVLSPMFTRYKSSKL